MPRYYFHVRNDEDVRDDEGQELPDLHAARQCALEGARDLICGNVKQGRLNLDHCIIVTDETDLVVMKLTFRDAFTIEGRP
jgi:hypothetical protein